MFKPLVPKLIKHTNLAYKIYDLEGTPNMEERRKWRFLVIETWGNVLEVLSKADVCHKKESKTKGFFASIKALPPIIYELATLEFELK